MPEDLKALHARALEQFALVVETEQEQRQRELQDLKFQAGDQWPDEVKAARSGTPAGNGQGAVPARPMLTVRSLDQPIGQIVNQARNARLAITVVPKGDGASQDTAQVFEDIIREIEYQSHAQNAYLWAYQRSVPAGRGFFRIDKDYEEVDPDPSDPARFDQVIRIKRILNQATVYLDPFAQQSDWSDGEWAFITEDIPEARYLREFKDSDLANRDRNDATLTSPGDDLQPWVINNDAGRAYRVAEYWFVIYDEQDMVDDSEEGREPIQRTVRRRKVMWAKMNGLEWLEEPQEWDGKYIPIPPVLANELNIGGKRIFEGVVAPSRNPCQMLNYMVTAAAEGTGLTTRPKWVGVKGQFEGFEDQWDQANARNLSKLEYNALTDDTGSQVLPAPQFVAPEAPIQAYAEMISMFTNFIRSTTGVPDAALGQVNPNDRSGKAIRALQQASEQGTSNYLDGLAKAIQYAGVILVDLIPSVYDREGRKIQVRSADGQLSSILLNVPFYVKNGEPVPLQPHQHPPIDDKGQPVQVKFYNLKRGKYTVVVEVGKSFATQREASNAQLSALAQAAPELVPRFADIWVEEMDLKKGKAIADRLKPPGTDDENVPPQVKAAIAGMQQQLQQAAQIIQTKQVEQQGKLQEAKLNADKDIVLQRMKDATSIAVAKINALAKGVISDNEGQMEAEALQLERTHDALQQERDRQHEAEMAQMGHQQALEQGAQQHAQAGDMALTQAALQPPASSGQ